MRRRDRQYGLRCLLPNCEKWRQRNSPWSFSPLPPSIYAAACPIARNAESYDQSARVCLWTSRVSSWGNSAHGEQVTESLRSPLNSSGPQIHPARHRFNPDAQPYGRQTSARAVWSKWDHQSIPSGLKGSMRLCSKSSGVKFLNKQSDGQITLGLQNMCQFSLVKYKKALLNSFRIIRSM